MTAAVAVGWQPAMRDPEAKDPGTMIIIATKFWDNLLGSIRNLIQAVREGKNLGETRNHQPA